MRRTPRFKKHRSWLFFMPQSTVQIVILGSWFPLSAAFAFAGTSVVTMSDK